ncbi:MAG: ribonuclease HII [Oscillospiraceae bacterium]|nr:ribonuclease HII [Oscillospiraceae bacterium]
MEKLLYSPLFEFDNQLREQYGTVTGIDEAGRGCLCGDVFAAAVILDKNVYIEGLNDSKKLSEKKREILYEEIINKATAYAIATASVEEIERLNILNAALLAMKRAYEQLNTNSGIVLIDGNKSPELNAETLTVVQGDSKSASIAAASILAKVARDRYVTETLDKQFPEYCLIKHKGYGTKLHYECLQKHGITHIHRKSFLKKIL